MAKTNIIPNVINFAIIALLCFAAPAYASEKSRIEACVAITDPGWTLTERIVWRQLCNEGGADLTHLDAAKITVDDAKSWPANRKINAQFLTQILSEQKYQNALPDTGITLTDVFVAGDIDLKGVLPTSHILFENSYLEGEVHFDNVRLYGKIVLGRITLDLASPS